MTEIKYVPVLDAEKRRNVWANVDTYGPAETRLEAALYGILGALLAIDARLEAMASEVPPEA